MLNNNVFRRIAVGLAAGAGATGALAQGLVIELEYEPVVRPVVDSVPIPTLGGGALVLLAIILAVVAVYLLRSRHGNVGSLLVAGTLAAAIASGVGGVKLVADAQAANTLLTMTEEDGGVLTVYDTNDYDVLNGTSRSQRIVNIIANQNPCEVFNGGDFNGGIEALANGGVVINSCEIGTELEPGEQCVLYLGCPT